MKRSLFAVAFLCLFAGLAHAQAVINEGLETATLYVDVVHGNDNNNGSQGAPFKTIGKGVAAAEASNQNGIGTLVYINPGLYRENINLFGKTTDTLLPETFQATTPGTVLITGADQFTNWTQYSGNSNIYYTPWTFHFGLCPQLQGDAPPAPDIMLHREMAFVNDTPLEQVLTMAQMLEGTFYVDDTGQNLYIWPANGTNVSTADIELADRGQLWAITNKNGVVLRGLTFEYSSDCVSNGAVEVNFGPNQNIEFDGDYFLWNNATGLHLFNPVTNFTVKNTTANHNGSVGMQTFKDVNALWQNDTTDYNNWRGGQAAYWGWGAGGLYPYSEINGTFSNITADWNFSNGVHWDTDNENTIATTVNARNNLYDGILLERDVGPMNLTGLNLCNNSNEAITAGGLATSSAGLALRESEFVTISNSLLYGNGYTQFGVIGLADGIPIERWQLNQMITVMNQNFTSTNNIFESTDASQNTFRDSYLNGADWTLFDTTLASGLNTWWNPDTTQSFVLPVPNPGTITNFAGYQTATGQDLNSVFAQPSGNPQQNCPVSADGPDLWSVTGYPSSPLSTYITLDPSGQATATYSYVALGGFNGALNLTMDGVSEVPGLSATLTPTTIPNASGSAVFSATGTTTIKPGTYQMTVLANSGSTTRTLSEFFVVPTTGLRFSPAMTLNFGTIQDGQMSKPQKLTIKNIGKTAITNLAIGTPSVGFTDTTTCTSTLAVHGSCTVTITFAPTNGLAYNGSLAVTDADPTSPQTVTLLGQGNAVATLVFSSYTLTFGQVVWNTTATLSSIVTNTGIVRATFTSFTFSGTGAEYYSLQTNTCAGGLQPGDMCTLTVAFTPEVLTKTLPVLTIVDNVLAGENTIKMTGTGKTSITVAPKSISFGSHPVGSNTTKTVTFTNAGNPIALTIIINGHNPADFSYTTTCPSTVPNGSCTISVTFTPQAKTSDSANLTLTDADPTSPQVVALTGTGT